MATIKFPGLKEYEKRLSTLGKEGKAIAEKAVYAGAAIIADAVRANINALPAVKDEWGVVAYNNNWSAPLTETAKKGLQDGFGISPMGNEDGILNVKLGFDGYNDMKTKKYPKSEAKIMINEPAVDLLIRKLGTDEEPVSRYALCVVAAKRARQIIEAEKNRGIHDFTGRDKEILAACKEIADGQVIIAKD